MVTLRELVGESYNGPIYSIIAFSTRGTLKKVNVSNLNVIVTYDIWVSNTIRKMTEAIISNFQMKKIYYSLQRNELKGRQANARLFYSVEGLYAVANFKKYNRKKQLNPL